jgi:putative ABC transport system permease protein
MVRFARTAGNPAGFAPQLRAIVRELAPEIAVETSPLSQRVSASVSRPRFRTIALVMFSALALALTVAGVYGVQSVSVSRRGLEWALRAAMGATSKDLVGTILREGLVVVGAGVALGLAAAAGLVRLAEGLLFGISRFDVVAFLAAPALVILIAVAGSLLPAARAAAVDPAVVLRQE